MTEPPPPTRRRLVLRLVGACLALPGGPQIGPIDWELERGRRIRVYCESDAHWDAFVALLSGQRYPTAGALEEIHTVRVQTDQHLRESMNLNQTIDDFLHSPDAPETVWLDGRRRALWVLVDQLGITPAMTRRPLKLHGPEVQARYWALRFLLSQADLVIGREVLRIADPDVQTALRRRWNDLPGALVVGESGASLPGPVDGWVRLDAHGAFSAGTEPPPEAG